MDACYDENSKENKFKKKSNLINWIKYMSVGFKFFGTDKKLLNIQNFI